MEFQDVEFVWGLFARMCVQVRNNGSQETLRGGCGGAAAGLCYSSFKGEGVVAATQKQLYSHSIHRKVCAQHKSKSCVTSTLKGPAGFYHSAHIMHTRSPVPLTVTIAQHWA